MFSRQRRRQDFQPVEDQPIQSVITCALALSSRVVLSQGIQQGDCRPGNPLQRNSIRQFQTPFARGHTGRRKPRMTLPAANPVALVTEIDKSPALHRQSMQCCRPRSENVRAVVPVVSPDASIYAPSSNTSCVARVSATLDANLYCPPRLNFRMPPKLSAYEKTRLRIRIGCSVSKANQNPPVLARRKNFDPRAGCGWLYQSPDNRVIVFRRCIVARLKRIKANRPLITALVVSAVLIALILFCQPRHRDKSKGFHSYQRQKQ